MSYLESKQGNQKLMPKQVEEIRKRRKQGERNFSLAIEYGVAQSTISMITKRKSWRQ